MIFKVSLFFKSLISIVLFFLCWSSFIEAQNNYKIQHLELPETINNKDTHCFIEDRYGYLYIGMNSGLFRFDGHDLKEIKFTNYNGDLINFGIVSGLAIDNDGDIWVASVRGLFTYNPQIGIARRFVQNEVNNISYRCFYVTKANEIVIGTNRGLRIYNKKLKTYKSFLPVEGLENTISHRVIRDIFEDQKGNLWIGTYNLLNKFDRNNNTFTHFDLKPKTAEKSKNNLIISIEPYLSAKREKLIIGTETGLVIFNTENNDFEIINRSNTNNEISNDVIKTVGNYNTGEIWFGTDYGLNKYSIANGNVARFFHQFANENSISNDVINTLYRDRQGNLWIGTNNGIDKIHLSNNDILFNQTNKNAIAIKAGIEVNSLDEDQQGNFWLATNQGLIKYDKATNQYIEFYPPQILHRKVQDVFVDLENNVWIATPGGINKYITKTKTFKSYTARVNDPNYLTSNYISCITGDDKGNIWVATHNQGLFKLIEKEGDIEFINFIHNKNNPHSIQSNRIIDILIDQKNNLWVVNYVGINKFEPTTGSFERVDIGNPETNTRIFDTYYGKNLWVATNKGIYRWNEENNNFEFITQLDFDIKGLVAHNNMLWFTSNSSIYKYSIQDSVLHKIPGYKSPVNDFKGKGFKSSTNRVFFSSYNGYVSFKPNELKFESNIPKVKLTEIQIFGKPINENRGFYNELLSNLPVNDVEEIKLNYSDNSFDISFSSLNLIDNTSISYSYMLEGYDTDWKQLTNGDNTAQYSKVSSGSYTFRVKAINPYGFQNEENRELVITINPPLWASKWAISIYIVLFVLALLLANRIIISRQQFKNKIAFEKFEREKSEELVEIKTKFYNSITHELKTPLTLIKTPIERMIDDEKDKNKVKRLELINRNAGRLIKLVNQILDIRKVEKGIIKLEIQEYNIVKFCKTVFMQFESEASERHINMSFGSNINSLSIWFDLDKLEKVLLNLLSNAYKFTPDNGAINLTLDYKEKTSKLYISVKDTGVGIKKEHKNQIFKRFSSIDSIKYISQRGSGIGLSLVKEYVQLHNGDIEFTSAKNKGTTFSFFIPTDKEALSSYHEKVPLAEDESELDLDFEDEDDYNEIAESTDNNKLPLLLIVEDEVDMRAFLEDSLSTHFKVIVASDGVEGLKLATKRFPDIIISDVMMPNMDGYELCETLKTDIRTSHIPIILLSARGDSKNKLIGVEFGADDYVGKPFKLNYLVTKAEKLIEQRNALKDAYIKQHSVEISKIQVSSLDENFLKKVVGLIEDNIENTDLNVKMLSEIAGMNNTNFYRKIKGLTGRTAAEFIRTIRLKKAAQLLKTEQFTVKEVMYKVGFSHSSYFSKSFKELFGIIPKDYK